MLFCTMMQVMKYLGIDYGTKRIGLATGDTEGGIAFAFKVIPTTHTVANDIAAIIDSEDIEAIVIGESKDSSGNHNAIMEHVQDLIGQLSLLVSVPIELEREDFTSSAARQPLVAEKNVARSRAKKNTDDNDARAAALILQRFLDKQGA